MLDTPQQNSLKYGLSGIEIYYITIAIRKLFTTVEMWILENSHLTHLHNPHTLLKSAQKIKLPQ